MSGLLAFGQTVISALTDGLIGPIVIRQRNIGGIIADVTVREDHEDELVVTENPVEQGAAITDHSFKQPARLTIDVGFSNSSLAAGGDDSYAADMYATFLALQASREPFDVITGKRQYTDMLITSLHTVTTEETENALLLQVKLKQVILVSTQTVSVGSDSNMTNPQSNGATQNGGTQQAQYAGGASGSVSATTNGFNYSSAPTTGQALFGD